MPRLVFVLAFAGSLAANVQGQGAENLPATVAVEAGVRVAKLQAAGAQIYVCAKNAAGGLNWTFREPVAALLEEGKTVGRHFVGPTWEFVDGSRVEGEVVTKAPGKTAKDIPWLKTLGQRIPEIGSRRRRNVNLTH
jgi:hypothetical protein